MVSKKKIIDAIAIATILVVLTAGYFLMAYKPPVVPEGEDKEFNVTAFQWGFDPDTIEVNFGDHVTLHIKSIDVTHGFAIDKYKINEVLPPNETVTVEFVADKTGTFEFYCSVPCGAGHRNQKGTLIVKAVEPM